MIRFIFRSIWDAYRYRRNVNEEFETETTYINWTCKKSQVGGLKRWIRSAGLRLTRAIFLPRKIYTSHNRKIGTF